MTTEQSPSGGASDAVAAPTEPVPLRNLGRFATARSRADVLADVISERIISEGLAAGASVGTLDELREETGFARSTVSEAVRLLRDRGIIEIRPGRGGGLFVAHSNPVVRLRRTLLSVQEQPTTVMDAIELREHLESMIDISAARCRTRTDVDELRAALRDMKTAQSWPDFMRGNWALHERIALVCPNAMARAVYIGTLGHLTASTTSGVEGDRDAERGYQRQRYAVHERLVDAIAAADEPAVLEAVRLHALTD